jgi:hypothetical protein
MSRGALAERASDQLAPLVGFVARWYEPLETEDGVDPVALEAAEGRLGVVLPASLKEYLLLAGLRRDLNLEVDTGRPDYAVQMVQPRAWTLQDGLVVVARNGRHPAYGYTPEQLSSADDPPPTIAYPDPIETVYEPGGHTQENASTLEFLCQRLVAATTLRGQRFSAERAQGWIKRLQRAGFEEPYPAWQTWPGISEFRTFCANGALVRYTPESNEGWAAIRTPSALEHFESLGVRWNDEHQGLTLKPIAKRLQG